MIAQEVFDIGMARLRTFKIEGVLPALRASNSGAMEDVMNINGNAYYQWSSCLVDALKPKQVVELGGAMGVWDIMVLHSLPVESKLYSVTLPEDGKEFSYVVDKYPNFYPRIGSDLDLSIWPKEAILKETDIWFIDTLHTEDQFKKELDLYSPFFKKDTIVLFDDIHIHEGMQNVWNRIFEGNWGFSDMYDATNPLHYTGFGIGVI